MATRQSTSPTLEETAATLKKNGPPESKPAPAEKVTPAVEVTEAREAADMEPSKRRMPDNLRRFLIRMQGGKMYLPAAYRIVWFRDEMGDDWGIQTRLIEGGHEKGFATVHADIVNPEGRVVASGLKTESKQDFPAGWVEKAESGAIARALAVLGFGTQFMPELDDDGRRPADSPRAMPVYTPAPARAAEEPASPESARPAPRPAAPASEIWEGPGQCPTCHAPEGKRHGRQCLG